MRSHYFQHVPFEGPGYIESWLKSYGYEITHTRFFDSTVLPRPEEVDFLVIMGGPMSVNDEDKFPWLALEKEFVKEIIRRGKRVLGICLGAQIIANAMGAKVFANSEKEIGWFPVYRTPYNDESIFRFPQSQTVFHWHGETFDLPSGAIRLANSNACENQAFQLGNTVIGLQFHLESTPESVREIVANCRDELIPSKYVQTAEDIVSASSTLCKPINHLMSKLLDFIHR